MTAITSPALHIVFDDEGRLVHFGPSSKENRLPLPVHFVALDTGRECLHPSTLTNSEGYLCFTFADGSLFYLMPEASECGIAFDTAGFFPSTELTDALCDDLSGVRIRFGLPESIPGAFGAEISAARPCLQAEALPEDGFMGTKLALAIDDAGNGDSISRLILFFA